MTTPMVGAEGGTNMCVIWKVRNDEDIDTQHLRIASKSHSQTRPDQTKEVQVKVLSMRFCGLFTVLAKAEYALSLCVTCYEGWLVPSIMYNVLSKTTVNSATSTKCIWCTKFLNCTTPTLSTFCLPDTHYLALLHVARALTPYFSMFSYWKRSWRWRRPGNKTAL